MPKCFMFSGLLCDSRPVCRLWKGLDSRLLFLDRSPAGMAVSLFGIGRGDSKAVFEGWKIRACKTTTKMVEFT